MKQSNITIIQEYLKQYQEDIQEAINQYTIQKRRDSKINQILDDEQTTIPNNRINLTIDIQNSMLD